MKTGFDIHSKFRLSAEPLVQKMFRKKLTLKVDSLFVRMSALINQVSALDPQLDPPLGECARRPADFQIVGNMS